MQALDDYKKLCDQFPAEVSDNPNKLLGLMGLPAADLLKNEIKEDNEKTGRKSRVSVEKQRIPPKPNVFNKQISLNKMNKPNKMRETPDVPNTVQDAKTLKKVPYKSRASSWAIPQKSSIPISKEKVDITNANINCTVAIPSNPYDSGSMSLMPKIQIEQNKACAPINFIFPQLAISTENLLMPVTCKNDAVINIQSLANSNIAKPKQVPIRNLVKINHEYHKKDHDLWQPIQIDNKRFEISSYNNYYEPEKIDRSVYNYLRKLSEKPVKTNIPIKGRLKALKHFKLAQQVGYSNSIISSAKQSIPSLYGTMKADSPEKIYEKGSHNKSFASSEDGRVTIEQSIFCIFTKHR